MIGSGATSVFIDKTFIDKQKLPTRAKERLETLRVLDGTELSAVKITHEADLFLRLDNHEEETAFQITKLVGYSAILEKSWLSYHEPLIS